MLQLESAGRVLKVSEANLEDSGKYSCLATNAAGEAQQHIRLSVHGNDARSISRFFIFFPLISVFSFIHILRGLVAVSSAQLFACLIFCVPLRASQHPTR